jgi:hypothetical protein
VHYHVIVIRNSRSPFEPRTIVSNTLFEGFRAYDHAVAAYGKEQQFLLHPNRADWTSEFIQCDPVDLYCFVAHSSKASWHDQDRFKDSFEFLPRVQTGE